MLSIIQCFPEGRRTQFPIQCHQGNSIYVLICILHISDHILNVSDLDGDEYFVSWDPTLFPPAMRTAFARQSPGTQQAAPRRSARRAQNMHDAAVDVFLRHRFSNSLGRMVTAWKKAALETPALADAPHAVELVELVEIAHVWSNFKLSKLLD